MANSLEGYIGALIAVVCFGTYAVPTKFFNTGDGMMFQWIQCAAIWLFGLMVQFTEGSFTFHPLAVMGGALWCLGNATVVPIVGWIGLSLGMLVWGLTGMIIGWACGHFGWFVGTKDLVAHPILNYIGLALALVSVLFYFPVKTNVKQATHEEIEPLNSLTEGKESPVIFKVLGLTCSVMAGVLYGFNMIPVSYLTNGHHGDTKPLHYVFSHFSGIFLCSTVLVLVYSLVKKNRPWFNNQLVLPGILSGTLWAMAQSAWFVANGNLGLSVAFPIITTGPGVVASVIGIAFFKEISGTRNLTFLAIAFALTFSGVICIALSNK